jgi:DTW domain-containing protein YfiP
MLVYPSAGARNLSKGDLKPVDLGDRQLVVFLLDATWALAKKMLRLSPSIQRLPRLMFTPSAPSRYVIKQQPVEGCLSTLEATHELLLALQRSGLDDYSLPDQLLSLFARMQDYQLTCARDPAREGYRRRAYSAPGDRIRPQGSTGARRTRLFNLGEKTPISLNTQNENTA